MINNEDKDGQVERLSSNEMAELIVDALLRANLVTEDTVPRAIEIATEEIEVRKVIGDY